MSELDRILDQRGMNSLKWEFTVRNGEPEVWKETDPELGEEQVLSMWVADMDFRTGYSSVKGKGGMWHFRICLKNRTIPGRRSGLDGKAPWFPG